MELLRLVALDQEDLAIVSAHLQDAIMRVGDLTYLPQERRFVAVGRRFDWEAGPNEPPRRRLTGLHFERVTAVRARGVDRARADAVLDLLAITFEEAEQPSGTVTLIFADGAAIQLDVECIELQMKDLGPVWEAESRPSHDVGLDSKAEHA
jgi:Protein of unknown function (DUF2948)